MGWMWWQDLLDLDHAHVLGAGCGWRACVARQWAPECCKGRPPPTQILRTSATSQEQYVLLSGLRCPWSTSPCRAGAPLCSQQPSPS